MGIYHQFINKPLKELQSQLAVLEKKSANFKIYRGICSLLEHALVMQNGSTNDWVIDPEKVRNFVFGHGPCLNLIQRKSILSIAADYFKKSESEIESALYADLPQNQVIFQVPNLQSSEILGYYNFSVIQSLLLSAVKVKISTKNRFKELLWRMKKLGLMFEYEGSTLIVYGPLSTVIETQRYGTAFGGLFATLIQSDGWTLEAEILQKKGSKTKSILFQINSEEKIYLKRNLSSSSTGDIENTDTLSSLCLFDSNVEKQFYYDFKGINSGWEILREPTLLPTKHGVFLPDFSFTRYGITVYFEIMGFWTEDYITKKLEKVRSLPNVNFIIAINKQLNLPDVVLPSHAFFYEKKISVKPVLDYLHTLEKPFLEKEKQSLKGLSIQLKKEITPINEICDVFHILPELIPELKIENGVLISNSLITHTFLKSFSEKLYDGMPYNEFKKLLDIFSVPTKILDKLGFKIEWKGLSPVAIKRCF